MYPYSYGKAMMCPLRIEVQDDTNGSYRAMTLAQAGPSCTNSLAQG